MASEFDSTLAELRALVQRLGFRCAEITVVCDGRVQVRFLDGHGYSKQTILTDLDPGSAHPLPSAAMRAAFPDWSGR